MNAKGGAGSLGLRSRSSGDPRRGRVSLEGEPSREEGRGVRVLNLGFGKRFLDFLGERVDTILVGWIA